MNNRCFACRTYHEFIDAGYRHYYWKLEAPGIVTRNKPVSVPAVLATDNYWRDDNGIEFADFDKIKLFLERHQEHDLIFAEDEDLPNCPMYDEDWRMFDWLDASPSTPDLSPRYFFERLGLRTWEQVIEWVARNDDFPWWWGEPTVMPAVEEKFSSLVSKP